MTDHAILCTIFGHHHIPLVEVLLEITFEDFQHPYNILSTRKYIQVKAFYC